jgi:hypothetical protein
MTSAIWWLISSMFQVPEKSAVVTGVCADATVVHAHASAARAKRMIMDVVLVRWPAAPCRGAGSDRSGSPLNRP